MAETEVRITAGIPSIGNTGEVDFFVTAGIPNAWEAPAVGQIIPIISDAGIHNAIFHGLVISG